MGFKAALEAKRHELVRAMRARTGELAIREGGHDPIDQVQSMIRRDETVMILHRASRILSDVDAALRAMSEAVYGACGECGGPISLKRLEAIPWASHCVGCQQFIERRETAQAARPALALRFDEEREAA